MSLIEVENLYYRYGDVSKDNKTVLENISFSIEKGSFTAILGHNGSGKSTLAKLLNGLLQPTKGIVRINGIETSTGNNKEVFQIRKTVGLVFQNPDNQMVASIVEDDVAFGPENIGIKREEIKERIEFALKATGTEEFRDRQASKLSGGQKQRVAIAGVLAIKPEILILDESTAMLDPKGRAEVMDVVHKLNEDGMTVIVITHYMEEAVNADRILVMSDGKIIADGKPKEIFKNYPALTTAGLSLPRATAIAKSLKNRGIDVDGEILTREELAEKLCELFAEI